MNNRKGFTLMELVIVLAVLAIIAAILIPTFLTTTDRARLRSDIQSAHVINNAMELYRVENNRFPGDTIEAVLSTLHAQGYLRTAIEPGDTQTDGAEWILITVNATAGQPAARRIVLNIPDSLRDLAEGLSDADSIFVNDETAR